jgi:hypothetical protein
MLLNILGFCLDMPIEIAYKYGTSCLYRAGACQTSRKKGTYALPA